MKISETLVFDAGSQLRKTKDGYLVGMPRVARVGIQVYRGVEVGKPEMDTVRVYRPEAEVFHKDSLASFTHRPITMDHPPEMVDASNWRKYAVGITGDEVARDGEFIRVPMTVMDAEAIRDIEAGKREISQGYTVDLDWTPGEFNGQAYDAVQRGIRGNHTAVVNAARGGSQLNFGDSHMTMKTIVVDGISLEVPDTASAVISRALDTLTGKVKTAEDSYADLKKKKDEDDKKAKDALEARDAEIVTLKQQLKDATDPAKIEAATKDRAAVIDQAKGFLGDKLITDGKSISDIRRQVVDAKLGDAAKGWTDEQVATSFATLAAAGAQDSGNPLRTALATQQVGDAGSKAHDAYVRGLADAWKQPAAAA